MTNEDRIEELIKNGCTVEGFIIIPKNDKIVPVEIRCILQWDEERYNNYLNDIKS